MSRPVVVETGSAAATAALAEGLASLLGAGDVVVCSGDLGAGKTACSQGIAAGLGVTERVTSPTFTIVQEYEGDVPVQHLDLYRLEQPTSADELFAQEEEEAAALGGLLAVEWPQRLTLPPTGSWHLQLSLLDPADPDAGRLGWLTPPSGA